MKPHIILGIIPIGNDTAAALMVEGKIIAACEEERYTGEKHSKLFPQHAIRDCLKIANITINEVNEIAIGYDPIEFIRGIYLRPAINDKERIDFVIYDIDRIRNSYRIEEKIKSVLSFQGPIRCYRHHMCHLASSYFTSGFQDAILVSYDGRGEEETAIVAIGHAGQIETIHNTNYVPHSLGLVYSAITFYLGWKHHCDEGIVMGLASYGNPHATIPGQQCTYYEVFNEILKETGDYDFVVDQSWMTYFKQRGSWVSNKFLEVFGPKREPKGDLTEHHKNIAAALQMRLEDIVINQLRRTQEKYKISNLAISGGVGLNCSMNGKILSSGLFEQVFVPPASGDAGTAIGACYLAMQDHQPGKRMFPVKNYNFYLGSYFSDDEVLEALDATQLKVNQPDDLDKLVAEKLANGKIVGWFQGQSEFGPRALGNRSILCRPYPAEMKDYLNDRVKFREPFRPFAPAVLWEHAHEYFQINQESPHMLLAVQVVPEKYRQIPAVVHIDGSCRVQTVTLESNKRLYNLLQAFKTTTGIPVLLNTSFNIKGQPIVNTPSEAIRCYQTTKIDCLVMHDYFAEKDE